MGVEKKQETLGFQAEVQQLLDLMIHALYQDREIFLRELISNAADALERLRFAVLKDDSLLEEDPDLKIRIEYNRQNRTITVLDNGIGMSRDDIIEQLGTIAKSGTKTFLERLKSDQTKDGRMIGQFGVGFYASFGVANKVEVVSRRAGLSRTEGVRWLSEGTDNYTVESIDRPRRGSKIILYLRDDADEFLDGFRLRQIIKKYSDHIALPIIMPREESPASEAHKKSEVVAADETVNTATALWTRNKKDIKDEEYDEFYKHIAHDFDTPLARLHVRVEGRLEYCSLVFIPKRAPFDLWDQKRRGGIKLYVRRVFITDEAEYLLPAYLRFVRGVVDADDLPLNISRETLQRNKTIDAIRAGLTKKILNRLTAMAKDDAKKYATFWEAFGRVLKEGMIEEGEREETLVGLLRFASTHEDDAQQSVSLADYVARMSDDQEAIYYVIADNFATAKNSPHLEKLRKDGIEVLLLSDLIIDGWLTNRLDKFKDHPLRSVAKGKFATTADDDAGADDTQTKSLLEKIKTVLEAKAKDVRTTERLTESAACLVADEQELGRNFERILKASGQTVPHQKPTLEINLAHPLVKKIAAAEGNQFDDWSHILFDQALLSEGGDLDDPATFVHRLNRLFATL